VQRLFITPILWLGLVLFAQCASVEFSVTPTNLNLNRYAFSISNNAAQDEIAFHVTVSARSGDIPSDSTADFAIVTHSKDGGTSIQGVKNAIRFTLKKGKRLWKTDFTVSHELLKTPGLCFVFTGIAHATIDGKSVAMPSADFYEIKLKDFVKP
jgi:hypothetical protein